MAEPRKARTKLVATAADGLRDMVFAAPSGSRIGSLHDLTNALDVGTVTIQQAARVLEHEGLLEARRGPGGGYYGTRPDSAAVGRSIAAYVRANPSSFEEAMNLTSLLFNELAAAAAERVDDGARQDMDTLLRRVGTCKTNIDCGAFEIDLQDRLFTIVDWPLLRLLTVVTLGVSKTQTLHLLRDDDAIARWKLGRTRIISAILSGDPDLARFEANRGNRRAILESLDLKR
ncbi:transcriptional regulator [uncultured Sphingomonas sp.]|uniref:transcriptional regulator n=1 Tax=uncultured Sphingomonas sp. TaxID=158754 RepID=UPI00260C5489|nr:transcriptional regulator [uncultured Sphingomonas sp.]